MHIFLCGELNNRLISARFSVIFFDQDVDFFSIFTLMRLSFVLYRTFMGVYIILEWLCENFHSGTLKFRISGHARSNNR